ncbi:MAG: ethylbenzene dehydrogenase-related protein [Pseudomonadota bacterium]
MYKSSLRSLDEHSANNEVAGSTQASRRGRRNRGVDLATFVLHWSLVAALALSFLSGMRIAADATDAGLSRLIAVAAPQGDVFFMHLLSAGVLVALLAGYTVVLMLTNRWRRILMSPRRIVASFRETNGPRWRSVNAIAYWFGTLSMILAMATGLYKYVMPGWFPAERVSDIHRLAAWCILGYPLLHVLAQAGIGGWQQLKRMLTFAVRFIGQEHSGLCAIALVLALLYGVHTSLATDLVIERVETPPTLDGRPEDQIWKRSAITSVRTFGGVNLPGGETTVDVRAVHDGERAWFLFEWDDPTRSLKHLPLIKTEAGWKVMQTGFDRHDEDVYYEDKFAVMLSATGKAPASGTVHLGESPLAGRPGPAGGRGLHYTTDGSIADVWHWKAVRSGQSMGLADDNHFGPPMEPYTIDPHFWRRAPVQGHEEGVIRYTGGYEKDWHSGGGVGMNWEIFNSELVTPLRLPADPGVLFALGRPDLTPHTSDIGRWWIEVDESLPYTPEDDHYRVGTILPSVLLKGPMTGDRADVAAQASWADGRWRLEMSRVLDTGSRDDVELSDGVYLWVAVFDHSQTRHSRHLHPIRLVFR